MFLPQPHGDSRVGEKHWKILKTLFGRISKIGQVNVEYFYDPIKDMNFLFLVVLVFQLKNLKLSVQTSRSCTKTLTVPTGHLSNMDAKR